MQTILEELLKVKNPIERRAKAMLILERSSHPDYEFPSGSYDPLDSDWAEEREIIEMLNRQSSFYDNFERIFGNERPSKLSNLRERFERNKEQTLKLTKLSSNERMKLPTSSFFPYFENFDDAVKVKGSYMTAWSLEVHSDDLTFTPELIGRGGFAEIYKAKHKDQREFALKLFNKGPKLPRVERIDGGNASLIEGIKINIFEHREFFLSDFFTSPRLIPAGYAYNWYVSDFFNGENVRTLLNKNELNKDLTGRILSKYAEMMQAAHQRGLMVGDNSWSNVLINDDSVKICDYDFITTPDKQKEIKSHQKPYGSREHYLEEAAPTFSSDLESLALMIDHILTGQRFIAGDETSVIKQKKQAKENRRRYSPDPDIPKRVAEVITPLINYPRNDLITAKDFREAIKLDFGI